MIKFVFIDVDGTLTDGKIYMGENGELFKAFNVKDGAGIKDILPQNDIIPVIVTARSSKILENRCTELGINHLYQGVHDKIEILDKILSDVSESEHNICDYSNCAYIGDDILDIQCMEPIRKAGGIVGCPADAVNEVKNISEFISSKNGGNGAVREFIEYIVSQKI